jgi:hypothetical protein
MGGKSGRGPFSAPIVSGNIWQQKGSAASSMLP